MNHYIIDGNNVIGKIASLKKLQQKDKQGSREKLVFMIDNFLHDKKVKCTIHFDGFEQVPIKANQCQVIYSNNKTADDKIKIQIEQTKNRKKLTVVTSDNNLKEFARVCSCEVLKSEDFGMMIRNPRTNDEQKIIDEMQKNVNEFRKLFGADED
ncbi:NYN domain-containing protein [bacterium BMS3Abin03]|jgi:hypothetical protein|nr:NYN domain-containing protein [bacterium BMS3Abin03]